MVSNIRELVDKYWEGETTIEEEQLIVDYFNQGDIDETVQHYTPLFQLIKHTSNIKPSAKLDIKLESIVANSQKETFTISTKRSTNHRTIRWSIAASILLIVGILIWQTNAQQDTIDLYADTFSTPEEALEFIKGTLEDLSYQVNLSTAVVEEEMTKISQLNEITN
jgi:cytoskeletal protein RodZ